MSEYSVPNANEFPGNLTSGPDGNIWYTGSHTDTIGRITPSGVVTVFLLEMGAPVTIPALEPLGIVTGPDGELWFTTGIDRSFGATTTNGQSSLFAVTTSSSPVNVTVGPDGNFWFTEPFDGVVGLFSNHLAGHGPGIIEYSLPSSTAGPFEIVPGPDGNLWFTEESNNKIGKITTGGTITEYQIPTAGVAPWGITNGPDGNLWFTELSGPNLWRHYAGRRHHRISSVRAKCRRRSDRPWCGWKSVVYRVLLKENWQIHRSLRGFDPTAP